MPIEQDLQALDWATTNPDDPRAVAITQKLGVGRRDLEAWSFAKANAQDPKSTQVVEKLVTKISQKGAPISKWESFARGAVQGAPVVGAVVDEIAGGLEAAGSLFGIRGAGGGFNEWRMETPEEKSQGLGEVYRGRRDTRRAQDQAAFMENPKSYGAGVLTGGVASTLIPGGAALTSSKLLPALGKAGALSAGTAAGTTEASPIDNTGQFFKDVGTGAAWGVGTEGLFRGVGAVASNLKPSELRKFAFTKANKAGGAMTKELRDLGPEAVQEQGKFLLDKKIVTATNSLEDIAKKASSVKADAGKVIGKALDDVDSLVQEAKKFVDEGKIGGPLLPPEGREALKNSIDKQFQFNMDRIADRIENDLIAPNAKNSFMRKELKSLQNLANDLREQGIATLREGTVMKGTQYQKTRFASETVPEAFKKQVGRLVKEELDDIVAKTGNLEMAVSRARGSTLGANTPDAINQTVSKAYQAAKKTYGASKNAEKTALKSLGRTTANRTVSLTDTIAGTAGGAAGAVLSGGDFGDTAKWAFVAGALNKLGRRYGNGVMAVSAYKAAQAMERSPQALGKYAKVLSDAATRGGPAVTAAHLKLMQEPEYRKILETYAEK